MHGPKWIVFVIKLNLFLPCFGFSALYLPTPDPVRHPASLNGRTQSMSLHGLAACTQCTVADTWFKSQQRRVAQKNIALYQTKPCFWMEKHNVLNKIIGQIWINFVLFMKNCYVKGTGKEKTTVLCLSSVWIKFTYKVGLKNNSLLELVFPQSLF